MEKQVILFYLRRKYKRNNQVVNYVLLLTDISPKIEMCLRHFKELCMVTKQQENVNQNQKSKQQ